jgi:hypothetical protein
MTNISSPASPSSAAPAAASSAAPAAAGGAAPASPGAAPAAPAAGGAQPAAAAGKEGTAAPAAKPGAKVGAGADSNLAATAKAAPDGAKDAGAEAGKDQGDTGKDPAKPEAGQEATPESYVQAIKVPEGVTVDPEAMKEAAAIFAKHKIPPEAAQEFFDFELNRIREAVEAPFQVFEELQSTIAKAIDQFGGADSAALRDALKITGAGNNPAILRFVHAMASRLTEGSHVGGSPPAAPKGMAEALYPNQGKKTA